MIVAKLAESSDGGENLIPATQANGLAVDVTRVQGSVNVTGTVAATDGGGSLSVDDGGGSLTVDGNVTAHQGNPGPISSPWPVRVSDGSLGAGVEPVDGIGALRVSVVDQRGASTLTDASQFTPGASRATVMGGVYAPGVATLTEESAAAVAITENRAIHANLRSPNGQELGTSGNPLRVDPVGTTPQPVTGNVTVSLPASTNAGAQAKVLNYHTGSGTDNVTAFGIVVPSGTGAIAAGTPSTPLRVDPTGSTPQPVTGTVTANQGSPPWAQNISQVGGAAVATAAAGVMKVGITNSSGGAIQEATPLAIVPAPSSQTNWRAARTFGADQTAVALKSPSGGRTLVVCGIVVVVATAGIVKIFDDTDSDSTTLFRGALPVGVHVINFAVPQKLSAANNTLRYSTGTGAGGDISVYGYEI
jgi:hypothetical protein